MSTQNSIDPKDAYILVIEDNLQNTIFISRLLEYIGVRGYMWKASGWEIFDVLDNMPRLDLVLLDLRLPREDGFGLLAKIRNEPRLANTRVVAVTAETGLESMERVKAAGFDGFLAKPISPKDFPQQLADILQGKPVWQPGSL